MKFLITCSSPFTCHFSSSTYVCIFSLMLYSVIVTPHSLMRFDCIREQLLMKSHHWNVDPDELLRVRYTTLSNTLSSCNIVSFHERK
jgi:rRNA pseudouridine-1189 N-methylase Emg1 (Nep1/Mra1 family)